MGWGHVKTPEGGRREAKSLLVRWEAGEGMGRNHFHGWQAWRPHDCKRLLQISYHKCVICLATIYSLHMDQKGKIDHQMLTMHVSQSCVSPAAVKKGCLARFVAVVPSQHVVRGLRVFDANYVFFGLFIILYLRLLPHCDRRWKWPQNAAPQQSVCSSPRWFLLAEPFLFRHCWKQSRLSITIFLIGDKLFIPSNH